MRLSLARPSSRGDVVYTSDFDDLERLRAFFPNVRVLTVSAPMIIIRSLIRAAHPSITETVADDDSTSRAASTIVHPPAAPGLRSKNSRTAPLSASARATR